VADRELRIEIEALDSTLASIESVLDITTLRARIVELEISASVPDLWDDPENAQKVTSELSNTQDEVAKLGALHKRCEDKLACL
jgi:peptide chain release factor 2